MEEVKHLSFDVWGTIVSVNPETKKLRTRFLADHFGLEPEKAHSMYSTLKASFDDVENNRANYCKDTDETYRLLVRTMRGFTPVFINEEAEYVRNVFAGIFLKAPPFVDPELVGVLRDLIVRRKKFTASLGSNSNFIPGTLMRDYLEEMIGKDVFAFAIHSDEIGFAKPNWRFFEAIKSSAKTVCSVHDSRRILHIGDNKECDLEGASEAELQSKIVSNPADTLRLLKELAQ